MQRAWRAFTAEQEFVCGYLQLHPLLAPDVFLDGPDRVALDDIFVLDLTRGIDDLRGSMSQARRRQLRRDAGPVLTCQAELGAFLVAGLGPFLRGKGASSAYAFGSETLELLVAAPQTFLLGAGTPDRVEAAALFAVAGNTGDYLFMAAAPGGERHSAGLIWEAALHLRARGVHWFNLGGGVANNEGVSEFKRRFGAQRHQLAALRQVYDPVTFDALCRLRQGPAAGSSTYFPPYHRPAADVR